LRGSTATGMTLVTSVSVLIWSFESKLKKNLML